MQSPGSIHFDWTGTENIPPDGWCHQPRSGAGAACVRWHQVTSGDITHHKAPQSRPGGRGALVMAAGILPRVHRLHVLCKAGIFQLFRVIHRVSDRNYKKLDEDIFVARSHTWSQSSRAGGRPSHFQASLHICWWWASANVIFSWLLFYWLRMSAWLARARLMPLSVSPTPAAAQPESCSQTFCHK